MSPPPPSPPEPPTAPPPPPSIIALIADDPDESEPALAFGDTLSLHFWPPTSTPNIPAGGGARPLLDRQTVDRMVSLTPPLSAATDYWAEWNSSTLLRITFGVVAAADAAKPPAIGGLVATCVPGNNIQSAAAPSAECSSASPALRGSWGYPLPPTSLSIVSFVALDADNAEEREVCLRKEGRRAVGVDGRAMQLVEFEVLGHVAVSLEGDRAIINAATHSKLRFECYAASARALALKSP